MLTMTMARALSRGDGELCVESADVEEAASIVALRDAAAMWQQQRGTHQWTPGEVTIEQVTAQITAGEWHVVRSGAAVLAALRVLEADPEVWGRPDDAALYVHGLVIDRAVGGQGVGARLLQWVEQRAQGSARQWVRLDCVASNEQLRDYYARHGFEVVGSRSFTNGWSAVTLLEKRVLRP